MTSNTRTTISLPQELLEATDELVASGEAKSRNQFIAEAIALHIENTRKRRIDAAFAEMLNDKEYQTEALQLEAEFAIPSWEVLNAE